MNNPYKINDDQVLISFSGGRSSAYMLYHILEANQGLPEGTKVCFANTGREMPETLDFVNDCSKHWGVEIAWLERFMSLGDKEEGENKYKYELKVVDYDSASRNGEPFESLANRPYLPNPMARFCTVELKIKSIQEYLVNHCGFEMPYTALIGIRGDEPHRAAKMNRIIEGGQERILPMYEAGVTKEMVGEFWRNQPFDLNLPNNNGVTDWGNCDLCFLKGMKKKLSIISAKPELADWWIKMEDSIGSTFRKDEPKYKELKNIALSQDDFFGYDDNSIHCFCGD